MFFQSEAQTRRDICHYGKIMYDKGFVAANDGNITAKICDDVFIVTPAGVSKGEMTPDILVRMDMEGNVLDGMGKPSSEVKMHMEVYRQNSAITAVVHAHPPVSTAFAVARRPLDRPILSEAIFTLGVVPVAEYATPGTPEVPQSIVPYVKEYNAVLLANHGLLTWGTDLKQAFFRLETAEQYSKIMYYLEKIGEPQELKCEKVAELVANREKAGITTGGTPPCKWGTEDEQRQLVEKIVQRVLQAYNGDGR